MKLKKLSALALAGVMAVSMLAGCAGKPATSEPTTEEPATTSLSASVVAALSADTTKKVTVTVDSDLESAIKSAVAVKGFSNFNGNVTLTELKKYDEDLPDDEGALTKAPVTSTDITNGGIFTLNIDRLNTVMDTEEKLVRVFDIPASVSEDYAVKYVADKIDDAAADYKTQSDVITYTANDDSTVTARINYAYTGTVALVSVTDPSTGAVNYLAVYTMSRTGSLAEV